MCLFLLGSDRANKACVCWALFDVVHFYEKNVFFPLMWSPIPWKWQPNSFALDIFQSFLVSGFDMSSLYSMAQPVVGWRTEFMRNSSSNVCHNWDRIWAVKSGAWLRTATAEPAKEG